MQLLKLAEKLGLPESGYVSFYMCLSYYVIVLIMHRSANTSREAVLACVMNYLKTTSTQLIAHNDFCKCAGSKLDSDESAAPHNFELYVRLEIHPCEARVLIPHSEDSEKVMGAHSLLYFIRRRSSSVVAVQVLIVLIEAAGLVWNLPWAMPAHLVPATASWYELRHYPALPDIWVYLIRQCWCPTILWSLTSWALPLLIGYLFNMTLSSNTNKKTIEHQYLADPLTFSVVKAILAYMAYYPPAMEGPAIGRSEIACDVDSGLCLLSQATVRAVRNGVTGGYHGALTGACVGIVFSMYDAALRH